jgi:hypothetical protein
VSARTRETLFVALAAFGARVAFAAWAGARFPAAADGAYYDTLARRLAHGDGYTWAWPDGAVTYAAHYPVGYPAILAVSYLALGASPVVAALANAGLGALAAVGVHRMLLHATSPKLAYAGAVLVGVHPALVAYTPAVMTEGITAALLAFAGALASRGRWRWLALAAIVLGVATLVRPQCVLLAPVLGALARRRACALDGRSGRDVLDRRVLPAVDGAKLRQDAPLRARERQRRLEPAHRRPDLDRRVDRGRRSARLP